MTRRRVLLAKPGLDGHDRGVIIIARALRDAGHEVIYTGIHISPAEVAAIAVQEDVDIVGLSILAGGHLGLTEEVIIELRERGGGDIPVILGGTIPIRDYSTLRDLGVASVFPVSTPLVAIVDFVSHLPIKEVTRR
jgi:methylmalonyl-CoA mutase C-terminal domain/subunit